MRKSSVTSCAPASIIMIESRVPATTRSSLLSSICWIVGLSVSSPSTVPTRTQPIGPSNGASESVSAAEALWKERADRAVGEARGEDALLRRTALAARERARDLARGVKALFEVDGQ